MQPPPQSSKKGLFIGIMAGVVIGLLGFAAYFLVPQNRVTAEPAPAIARAEPVVPPVSPPEANEPEAVEPDEAAEREHVENKAEPARKKAEAPPPKTEEPQVVVAAQPESAKPDQALAAKEAQEAAGLRGEQQAARRAEEEAAAEKARQAQLAAVSSSGTLLVKSIPALPGRLDGQSISSTGRVALRNTSGMVALGDADSPLRVTIAYRVDGGRVVATVNTEPWSILWVGDASKGKVPQTVEIGGAIQKLEFRAPGLDPAPRVMVMFTKE